jgi:penicillin-binding protein 1A
MFKKIFYTLVALLFVIFIGIVGYIIYLYNSTKFDSEKLIYYSPKLTTQFYDRNNKLVANIFQEHRLYAKYDEIPGRMIEAIIAIEDTSFFEHFGINVGAIFRALAKDIKAGKKVEGASTITQQLVKNVLLTREKRIERKIKEIFISIKLERILTKEEILERYLNEVYLGHGYYGVKTAANGYFRKNLNELTLKEMAMIVSLPKAPSFYNPIRRYEHNIARANAVLRRMHDLGWINHSTYKKSMAERPKVYNDTRTKNLAPYVIDVAKADLEKRFKDLSYGGYRIKLSIDLEAQKIAKDSLKYGYEKIKKIINDENETKELNGAMVTIDSKTGDILALVGGVNYEISNFNRATQSKRSIGSAIKPFIYQLALNIGYNPATKIPDISRTYKLKEAEAGGENLDLNESEYNESDYWKPQNYEKNTLGLVSLRYALIHSRNLATINLVNSLGLDSVIRGMYAFGFNKIPHNLSLSLGTVGANLIKFSEEYTIFSNYGQKVKPRLILEIQNIKKELDIKNQVESIFVIEPKQAYLMVDILKDVVKKGTGRNARVKGIEIAGKTGTTNDFVDAWFCGFTPSTQTIVWFGNDNNTPLAKKMSGGKASAPVFKRFYTEYLKIHPELKRKFEIPEGIKYYINHGKKEMFTDISKPNKNDVYVPIF